MLRMVPVLVIVLILAGCAPAAMRATSPLAPVATPAPQPLQLTLVHSNDTWGYLLPCG
jgi:2',3'-cyclic-nucleotide 2'-phosphodiesterase (5'-nucleotidase family)